MELQSTLENLAEVGVAITGFAGIVAVVAYSSAGSWGDEDRGNFRALVRWSLGAAFLAYLPIVLFTLDIPAVRSWRIANGVFAIFHGYIFYETLARVRARAVRIPPSGALLFGLGVLVWGAEVAAAAGPLSFRAPAVYLVAVLWFLFLAATRFLVLVRQHFADPTA